MRRRGEIFSLMKEERIQLVPELTALALTYSNRKFIAENILPKVPVNTRSFQYRKYDKSNYFHVPETKIGEKGEANEVEYRGVKLTETVEDHALKEYIPISREKENLKNGINRKEKATNQLTKLLKTRKEILVANLLADVNSYGGNSGNVKTLSAQEKVNNDNANAVKIIQSAADAMLYAPNVMVTSRYAMSALRMNPFVVDACSAASRKAGIVSIEALKDLFGLDEIFVGESVVDTAKKGQATNLQLCWGNHISLLHIDKDADTEDGITFGFEAEYEPIQVGEYYEGGRGTQGCDVIKAYYSSKYLSVCEDCGYLLKDVLGS